VDGFGEEVSVAELVVCNTTWFSIVDVLPRLAASPTYTALSGKEPALRFDLVKVATPLLLSVAEPIVWPLHVKLTFPVGVVEPVDLTLAVQVIF
jgi:hypothetical protein